MAKKFTKPTDGYLPDAPAEVLSRSIEEFNLYEDTVKKLKSVGLDTIGDVASVEMRSLYRIEKMNKRDVFAALRMLKSVKLDFRQVERPAQERAENDGDKGNNQPRGNKSKNANAPRQQAQRAGDNGEDRQQRGKRRRGDGRAAANDGRAERDAAKDVLPTLERERVNTRDYDAHGNKRRDRDGRDGKDRSDTARARRDKKPAVVNLPPLKLEDGLYKFYKGGKWGYKDEGGKVVIEPIYDEAYNFSEGLAGVEIGEKVGFINTAGEMVIPPIYDSVTSFKEGLASVTAGDKCAYIDKDGNEVFGFEYEAATSFTNNVALVKKDGKWGYMDRFTGEIRLR